MEATQHLKPYMVWLGHTSMYQYDTITDAMNLFSKMPTSVLVEQMPDDTYLLHSRRFEQPIACFNYWEVKSAISDVF